MLVPVYADKPVLVPPIVAASVRMLISRVQEAAGTAIQ